ncbi:MAG: uroporphyrinogen-III decarboxylase-like protein [Chloroflexi bacterium]|nr:uroporphyrinogen-III decarboxylase-like protein [Chloroflexota bacterium]
MPRPNYECLWPERTPDFSRLQAVFRRETPDRVPFIELFADPEIIGAVLNEKYIPYNQQDRRQCQAGQLQRIRFCYKVGWDFVWLPVFLDFRQEQLATADTAGLPRSQRRWVDESHGVIQTWEDFERYPWPSWSSINDADFEFMAANLPEGMKMTITTGGVLEWVMWLMGFVPFSLALYEQPDLVEAMFNRIGDILSDVLERAVSLPGVGAYFLGDDMGYKTGTFIKPAHLRQVVFPQQKRLAQITHAHSLPFLLHACGNLETIMDDLIDEVGIDARHSFEDSIMPVAEVKKRYGDRIAILGGVDMHFLATRTEEEVRVYTRKVLEDCMPGGGYALGTGNSVANYIPLTNYLAMLDEGHRMGKYA